MKVRKLLGALAASGMGLFMAAEAFAQAPDHYRGRACIISTNNACNAVGYAVGDCALARYRPPNAFPGLDDTARLSLHFQNYAQNFRTDQDIRRGLFTGVDAFTAIGSAGTQISPSRQSWRIVQNIPANYSQDWIVSLVDIFRYDDFGPGSGFESLCQVRYRITGTKFPIPAPAGSSAPAQSGSLGNGSSE